MPNPIFFGPAIDVAADSALGEMGGIVALGNGDLLGYWMQWNTSGIRAQFSGFEIRVIDSLNRSQSAPITLDLGLSPQYPPEVVGLSNGNFVVSWLGKTIGGGYDSYFRVFNASWVPVTPIKNALPNATNGVGSLDITALSDGGFVAAWDQFLNGSYECFAQTYDATGTAQSSVFRLNDLVTGSQGGPEIQALSGGRFIAIWTDLYGPYQDLGYSPQVARLFQADGNPLSEPFAINQSHEGDSVSSQSVSVTDLTSGNIAVAWRNSVDILGEPKSVDTIVVRMFTNTGEAAGDETVISVSTPDTSPVLPVISKLLDGRFMVAWMEVTYHYEPIEQYSHVLARVINADGTAEEAPFRVDGEFRVDGDIVSASSPTIATLLDGRVAVSYNLESGTLTTDFVTQILDPRIAAIDLQGSDAGDHLQGTRFADTVAGGLGDDAVNGGFGADRLFGEAGNDVLHGGAGSDVLVGSFGHDVLTGGTGDDTLAGGFGHDVLNGGAGRDSLSGGSGRDSLSGGGGNDTLVGGLGDDVLTGDAGNDTFEFYTGLGADKITDFELGHDLLNLRAFHFSDAAAAFAAFSQTAEGVLFAVGDTSILLTGIDLSNLTGSSLLI